MNTELTRAEEAALLAMRDGRPVPDFAVNAIERLLVRGLADRCGLTPSGARRADDLRAALTGLNAMIAKPHKRDTRYERSRSWTR